MPRDRKPAGPTFRYFNSSPEVIRLVLMMYIRFPLSLRNGQDLPSERGIDICHETVRHWLAPVRSIFAMASLLNLRAGVHLAGRGWCRYIC
jgi:putative transposase